jgi:hypothetical protein
VRFQLANQRDGRRSNCGLPDDVKARIGFEEPSKPVAKDRVLIGDHDPHGRRRLG